MADAIATVSDHRFWFRERFNWLAVAELDVGPDLRPGELAGFARWRRGDDEALSLGLSPESLSSRGAGKRLLGYREMCLNSDDSLGVQWSGRDLAVALGGRRDVGESVRHLVARMRETQGLLTASMRLTLGHWGNSDRDYSGFLDGTSNLQEHDGSQLSQVTQIQRGDRNGEHWRGWTYVLLRPYEEKLSLWNRLPVSVQEQLVGRRRVDGAYLDHATRWTPDTWHVTPRRSHIRAVNPRACQRTPWFERLYRRSIPVPQAHQQSDPVLLVILAMRDPHRQLERIYNERLVPEDRSKGDLLITSGYFQPQWTSMYLFPGSV